MMRRLKGFLDRGASNFLLIMEGIALIVVILVAVLGGIAGKKSVRTDTVSDEKAIEENAVAENIAVTENVVTEEATEVGTETPVVTEQAQKPVEEQAEPAMSMEEAIDRIVTSPEALTGNDELTVTRAGATTESAYSEYPVGGLLYRTDNLNDATQATSMLKAVTDIASGQGVENPVLMVRETDLQGHEADYHGYGINTVLIDTRENDTQRTAVELEESISAAQTAGYGAVLLVPAAEATEQELSRIREEAGFDGDFASTVGNVDEAGTVSENGVKYLLLGDDFRTLYPGVMTRLTE